MAEYKSYIGMTLNSTLVCAGDVFKIGEHQFFVRQKCLANRYLVVHPVENGKLNADRRMYEFEFNQSMAVLVSEGNEVKK